MTTDRDTLKAMLDRAGIVYKEAPADPRWDRVGPTKIIVVEGEGPNNLGYSSFETSFFFNEDGALLAMGAWE
jgi:hypothetical protein